MLGEVYLRREILHFKIDWASLIIGSKFTIFALLSYFEKIAHMSVV